VSRSTLPTRGQALEKAGFRLLATVIGVVASIALVGTFSQERDLLLLAFVAWVGLCIAVAALSDGNRAYDKNQKASKGSGARPHAVGGTVGGAQNGMHQSSAINCKNC
jgi:hypothetical protein